MNIQNIVIKSNPGGVIYDPLKKLELLREYTSNRIDKIPYPYYSFRKWMKLYYPCYVFGTMAYVKLISTHCFYCNNYFKEDKTIDHFYPKSKVPDGSYEGVYVICCKRCNKIKADIHPNIWIRKMTVANMTGSRVNNLSKREVGLMAKSVNVIFNDALFNNARKVYYINKYPDQLPPGFYRTN